ncbi:MAG: hypothetical protein V4590_10325 [Bacteroidota bacterium]
MKKQFAIIGLLVLLASCKTAMFESLPGEAQQQFPAQIQGTYYAKWSTGAGFLKRKTDSLFFEITPNSYTVRDSGEFITSELDETHRLRLLNKKYYVVATQSDEYKKYWNFVFIEQTKKGLKIMGMMENPELPKNLKRSFVALNNAGDSIFVYKPTDVQLTAYYEKLVRKNAALEVFRLKK